LFFIYHNDARYNTYQKSVQFSSTRAYSVAGFKAQDPIIKPAQKLHTQRRNMKQTNENDSSQETANCVKKHEPYKTSKNCLETAIDEP